MVRATAESLLNETRAQLERSQYQQQRALTGTIRSDDRKGLLTRTGALEDGSGHYGIIGHIVSHTSYGGVQSGQTDPEKSALNLSELWAKDEDTSHAARVGMVIVQNSDGTFVAVSEYAY